jgi:hypothetical protein
LVSKKLSIWAKKANGWFNALEKSELNKIIGESYFNLKQYSNAPSFRAYKKKEVDNTDFTN